MEDFLKTKDLYCGCWHKNLPQKEKETLQKFYNETDVKDCVEGCDGIMELAVFGGIHIAGDMLVELELETGKEDRKAFLEAVLDILGKCAEKGVEVIYF